MAEKYELSIIVPYTYGGKDRERALYSCLDSIKDQLMQSFELIIVEEVLNDNKPMFSGHPRVNNHIILRDNRKFNKSWIINVAARKANTNSLVIIDADSIMRKEHFGEIFMYRNNHPQFKFFCAYLYLKLQPGKDNPVERLVSSKYLEAIGGAWFCYKDFFFNTLGGINENYFGYGAEDNDMWWRVQLWYNNTLGNGSEYPIPMMPVNMVHQYHDWAPFTAERYDMLNKTRNHPDIVTRRLVTAELGKESGPTLIKADDIKIEKLWYK